MTRAGAIAAVALLFAGAASAGPDCANWVRLSDDQKRAKIDRMIDGHLGSDVGKRYTSENKVRMRRCLEGYVEDLYAEFDGACADGGQSPMDAIDEIFDRYFLSCVQ